MARRAVFLDRDGVVNALVLDPQSGLPESPLRVEDVALLEGVPQALVRLREAGFLLICVTNQPAAAKLKTDVESLLAVNDRIRSALSDRGADFDDVETCLHHPDGLDLALTIDCACRKPRPGLLIRAAIRHDIDLPSSWIIGDSDSDMEAGAQVGCSGILIEHPDSSHRRGKEPSVPRVPDLPAATQYLLATELRRA